MPHWMRPHGAAATTLPGEVQLVAAVLHQAVRDAQSPSPSVQAEARAFLADPQQVTFWATLAGLDAEVLLMRVEAVLGR